MNARFAPLAALALLHSASAAFAGEQTRELASFSRLRVNGSTDVDVRVGAGQSVIVEGSDSQLDRVVTEVKGDTLVVSNRGMYLDNERSKLRVHITVPRLNAVEISGSGDVQVNALAGSQFAVAISGSGDVKAQGSGVDSLSVTISGSGDADLRALPTRSAAVNVAGSGDVKVNVTEALSANLLGSGDIRYAGNPRRVNKNVAGSGEIEPL